jgi:hypothetical protein
MIGWKKRCAKDAFIGADLRKLLEGRKTILAAGGGPEVPPASGQVFKFEPSVPDNTLITNLDTPANSQIFNFIRK